MIRLAELVFRWPGSTFTLALERFELAAGERVLLLGESGSGKSTLLSLICGTLSATEGVVDVNGTDLARLSGAERDRFRAEHIGVVFQQFNLLPFGTVTDNILLPLSFAPERRKRAGRGRKEALRLCRALGLPDDVASRRARDLSVGQQQRVAVARALIGAPPLLVADEPTSALDMSTQGAFLDLLFSQADAQKTSVLMVSHDPRLGDRFDRVVEMSEITQAAA